MPDAPIWGDIKTLRGRVLAPYRELAKEHPTVITAGFPCQPWAAGGKGRGQDDDRNLWPETLRVIREVRPTWVFLENSTRLLQISRRWDRPPYIQQITGDLAVLGYVGRWGCLSAADLGFDHKRRRLWIVAHAIGQGREVILRSDERNSAAHNAQAAIAPITLDAVWSRLSRLEERLGEPSVFRTDDGLAHRVERLEAIGEGQVPAVAKAAWRLLTR